MPHLVQMQEEYGSRGVQVFGITEADRDEAQGFVTRHSLNYPVLVGAGESFDEFGIDLIWGSAIRLVDPEGVVVADDLAAAQARIEEALGAPSDS